MQKPCNYYDKYIKYKKKYIDYKNKLDMKGGGIDANIDLYTVKDDGSEQHVSSVELPSFLNGDNISRLHIKIIYINKGVVTVVKYRFREKVGSGSYGDVYQIEQVEPVPQPGSPNFVIKLNIKGETENMDEGIAIDTLTNIPPRIKAIFQGNTDNIVFAIYNYLGQDLNTFFRVPANLVGFTQEQYRSLIEQLHTQLHTLNSQNQFHNDVKIDNIVIRKLTGTDDEDRLIYYELSLIDYGILTKSFSDKGSFQCMCIRGCARFLHNTDKQFSILNRRIPLFSSKSTDYVGFFHTVIFLINPTYKPFDIYREILNLIPSGTFWHTSDNICKVLCLLCYVSGCSDKADKDNVNAFLGNYTSTVTGIDKVLKGKCTGDNFQKFTSFIPDYEEGKNIYTDRRLLFLYFIYSKIIVGYHTFIPIVQIPLFLWRLSCCFDFRFNLEQFNTNFDTIFTSMPIVTMSIQNFFSNPANLVGFTSKHMMSLIRQLHTRLHILNSTNSFHNNVKIDNIVMYKLNGSDEYELSLTNSKLLTNPFSDKGTFYCMCIRGCAKFLHETPKVLVDPITLYSSTSTDYVAFFHVVVFLLNPKIYKPFDIYIKILDLTSTDGEWYTLDNICKVLCLLCYVSECSDIRDTDNFNTFLGNYTSTVTGIDEVLKSGCTEENLRFFTSVIPSYVEGKNLYRDRRILFLCFIYSKITEGYGVGYSTFIPIVQVPLFLWKLSCCFDFRFDLEQFNRNFGDIFTPMPLVPGQ